MTLSLRSHSDDGRTSGRSGRGKKSANPMSLSQTRMNCPTSFRISVFMTSKRQIRRSIMKLVQPHLTQQIARAERDEVAILRRELSMCQQRANSFAGDDEIRRFFPNRKYRKHGENLLANRETVSAGRILTGALENGT